MPRIERIIALERLLQGRRTAVSMSDICRELEISRATAARMIQFMRDSIGAPIVYDREQGGYRYDPPGATGGVLPGLWFSAQEWQALSGVLHLVEQFSAGALTEFMRPLRGRIDRGLRSERIRAPAAMGRVRVRFPRARQVHPTVLRQLLGALGDSRRVQIELRPKALEPAMSVLFSPVSMIFNAGNWYLYGLCDGEKRISRFPVHRIAAVEATEALAERVSDHDFASQLDSGYGTVPGAADKTAIIRFSPDVSGQVVEQTWHPNQVVEKGADGSALLCIPYLEPDELLRDILSFGEEAEVIGPPKLRTEIRSRLSRAAVRYENHSA